MTFIIIIFTSTNNIEGKNKEEFYQFIESLANSTYNNFNNIKDFKSVEVRIFLCILKTQCVSPLINKIISILLKTRHIKNH